ncbi:MAG: hypothetical protein MUF58_09975, partial [Arcicella sp.]|nr:hypothetical protein [Arcicella sp.]
MENKTSLEVASMKLRATFKNKRVFLIIYLNATYLILCLSCPEIAIQKSIVMEEYFNYVKRSQRDYSMSLK